MPFTTLARTSRWALLAGTCITLLGNVGALRPEGDSAASEYEVKAAMLRHFINYTTWPKKSLAADAEVKVCVLGRSPFDSKAEQVLTGKTIAGHKVALSTTQSTSEAASHHVLFIPKGTDSELVKGAIAALQRKAVLIVSDEDDLLDKGAMIGFVIVDKKVRFRIDGAGAKKHGLIISSKLISLALK